MTDPCSQYVTLLDREIHYVAWGDASLPPVYCWHGLARTCRDFDALAQVLSATRHVIAADMIGRGFSQWSPTPETDYCNDGYARIATALADTLGHTRFDWIGTSMGGAFGIRAAAGPLRGRIDKLVLNDMGPQIATAAVDRIRSYAGAPPRFARVSELEAYFRTVYKPYGYLPDAQWRQLTETSARRLPDGSVTPHYDPAMVMQFTHHPQDYAQWAQWDVLTCDVLCMRGATSDLLLAGDAQAMTRRGPRCQLETIEGCGHAPALNVEKQIALVTQFLRM